MAIINASSFELVSTETKTYTAKKVEHSYAIEYGTVEVTLGRTTKRVAASRWPDNGNVVVHDAFSGRYVAGGKVWPASVSSYPQRGFEIVNFGRDDRSGRFNKANGLFWN